MSRASRRTLVSHKLRDFNTGDPELDKQLDENQRDHVAQVFEKIRQFDKYTPDHEITSDEIDAGVSPTAYQYSPGDVRRYGGGIDKDAATNTSAFQDALDSNQTVHIEEEGTHLLSGGLLYHDNNRIVGRGKGTVLKWNVTNTSFFRGTNAASTRLYRFGMRDLLIDGTS